MPDISLSRINGLSLRFCSIYTVINDQLVHSFHSNQIIWQEICGSRDHKTLHVVNFLLFGGRSGRGTNLGPLRHQSTVYYSLHFKCHLTSFNCLDTLHQTNGRTDLRRLEGKV